MSLFRAPPISPLSLQDSKPPKKMRRFSIFRKSSEAVSDTVEDAPSATPSSSRSSTGSLESGAPPAGVTPRANRRRSAPVRLSSLPSSNVTSGSVSTPLGRVPEDPIHIPRGLPEPDPQTHEDGLPTYASATYPSRSVTYHFLRSSAFSMVLVDEASGESLEGHGLYHISVALNIWMPSCTVTTIRRGSHENGPIIAELELGIMEGPATVTIGRQSRRLNQVMLRTSLSSSSRTYFTGDGESIKWKLDRSGWQALVDSKSVATFSPSPPRKLTLQPIAHRLFDHIVIGLVILMREHLTPRSSSVGEAAFLFNYSPRANHD